MQAMHSAKDAAGEHRNVMLEKLESDIPHFPLRLFNNNG